MWSYRRGAKARCGETPFHPDHPATPDFLWKSLPSISWPTAPSASPSPPPCRACGTEFTTREIPNWDRSELLRLTDGTYYWVPVLVHDGRVVGVESQRRQRRVIATTIMDEHFAGGRLFPGTAHDGAPANRHRITERRRGIPDLPPARSLYTGRHYGPRGPRPLPAAQGAQIWPGLRGPVAPRCRGDPRRGRSAVGGAPETTLRHSSFLFGDAPVYSDFLLYGILGNLTYGGHHALHPDQTCLGEWSGRMAQVRFQRNCENKSAWSPRRRIRRISAENSPVL